MTRARKRVLIGACVFLALLLLAVVPPLVNVGRLRRRIATSVSQSIGRPVRIDNVTMTLLPFPGFTLENFVIGEDPRFGNEPVMRANVVHARLRFSSLWRRRIEISTISLEDPSINLVRNAAGEWNVASVLRTAQQIDSAPTSQAHSGAAPRFPYIEASGARINIKRGDDKLPFSVTDADLAFWLPDAQEWKMRLKGHPARTDTDASDTGTLSMEATLHQAANLADVPVQAEADWKRPPLGEASKLFVGSDTYWRGQISAHATLAGTIGDAQLNTQLHLTDVRRADFVPARTMQVDAECEAHASGLLHELHGLRCAFPVDAAGDDIPFITPQVKVGSSGNVALTGDVPNVFDWSTANLTVGMAGVAPGYAVDWLRIFSIRIPRSLNATGEMHGSFTHDPATAEKWTGDAVCDCSLALTDAKDNSTSLPVNVTAQIGDDGTGGRAFQFTLASAPTTKSDLPGGAADGWLNAEGFHLHLPASNAAEFTHALAQRIPPLFDNAPVSEAPLDLTSYRRWGSPTASWIVNARPAAPTRRKR